MKKKSLIFFLSFFITMSVYSQIDIFEEKEIPTKKEITVSKYDSLTNMVKQKYGKERYTYHHLIGQTLLYCGNPYDNKIMYMNDIDIIFKKGEYYKVDTIIDFDYTTRNEHLLLTELKTGIKRKYPYNPYSNFDKKENYSWVVVGHYEKLKSIYLDNDFLYLDQGYKDNELSLILNPTDVAYHLGTDSIHTSGFKYGSKWKCIGIQVKPRKKDDKREQDSSSPIVLLFDNPQYGTHYCYWEDWYGKESSIETEDGTLICERFMFKNEYEKLVEKKLIRKNNLIKRFGTNNANLILDGEIRIGMTKEMCREAWGTPDEINTTYSSYGNLEQWIYGNSYVYFRENKITTIQEF